MQCLSPDGDDRRTGGANKNPAMMQCLLPDSRGRHPAKETYVPPERADLYLRLQGIKDAAETFGLRAPLRFRVSSIAPDAGGNDKRIHLVRHGQGLHNAYMDECIAAGKVPAAKLHESKAHPHLIDPVLTARGEAEAVAARAQTAELTPELLVVSPLRRATATCQLAFERQWLTTPIVAHPLCREGFGSGNIYDMHLPPTELQAQFPTVDYNSYVDQPAPGEGFVDAMYANHASVL